MNQDSPIKIFHFHNGTGGGVLSVIRNLLAYRQSSIIENHVIYTINKEEIPLYSIHHLEGAASERVFYYSSKWNFYHTCSELALLLPDSKSVIVAHDWIELGMISNLGISNPTVQFLHGDYDYYYRLALSHEDNIDQYICVANRIAEQLKLKMKCNSGIVHYLRFPVPKFPLLKLKDTGFHIVFAGRCEKSKGYDLLPVIQKLLELDIHKVHWHIAGPGSDSEEKQKIWMAPNVTFYGNLEQEELQMLLCKAHVFILPSLREGLPVSVIEAMKAGAVPVVNDLKGGLQEIVIDGVTGFLINNNDPSLFAKRLSLLINNENCRQKMAAAASSFANDYFSPEKNTLLIEEIFIDSAKKVKMKKSKKIYGSRLDHPKIPNSMTYCFRSLIRFFGNHHEI
jgi:glycosyltransferase involved in cell wall biosynthesis